MRQILSNDWGVAQTIGALPAGLSDMPWHKFSLLNVASTAVWAGLLVGAGNFFEAAIEEGVANVGAQPASYYLRCLSVS